MSRLEHPYGTIDAVYGMHLATMDATLDGPVWMFNLLRYREVAAYATEQSATVSGREADDRYAPVDVLRDIGAEVVLYGDVVAQHPVQPPWHRVGVVRYPTRRSFIDMQARRDFRDQHQHKAAGVEFTIVMGCLPTSVPGRFEVEGTIIGDERRWGAIDVTRHDDAVHLVVSAMDDLGGEIAITLAATIDVVTRGT